MLDKFKDSFKEEAEELLNSLEDSLLILENNPLDQDAVAAVFRIMHTIKGSAGMFGFTHISTFTHDIEDFMDDVRSGLIAVSPEMIDYTLEARDHIRGLLLLDDPVNTATKAQSEAILEKFKKLIPEKEAVSAPEEDSAPILEALEEDAELSTYRIRFEPDPEIMKNGTRPFRLVKELSTLGDISISSSHKHLPDFESFDPEKLYLGWTILLTTAHSKDAILDVFMFVDEDKNLLKVDLVDDLSEAGESRVPLGEILVNRGLVQAKEIEEAVKSQKRLGNLLVEQGMPPEEIRSALDEQEHIQRTREKFSQDHGTASIRVSSEKLDSLVDLVGELVTLQARLSQTSRDLAVPSLNSITETLERLSAELRSNAMEIRMLPIGGTFSKFKRMVRDLSKDLGKEVDLCTEGAETELDKTILEKLNDPLVHMIRNCIDHGIETPADRKAGGKPEKGTVLLSACHSGASVLISIKDDGRGLDLDRIRQKAIDKGFMTAQANPSKQDLINFILMPGFSTAQTVSKVSGRGVGLDVVKKEIENLGGTLHVESELGKGTSMILEIPLTLAIIEGLLVHCGEEHYIFHLSSIEECLELDNRKQAGKVSNILEYRNQMLPLIHIREILGVPGKKPPIQQVVVLNHQNKKIGAVVDGVIGDHQTVIKNLGKVYKNARSISGATILGDGSVALILDIAGIVMLQNTAKLGVRT